MNDALALGQMASVPAVKGTGNLDVLYSVIIAIAERERNQAFDPSPPLRQDCGYLEPIDGRISAAASAGGGASIGVAAVLTPESGLALVAAVAPVRARRSCQLQRLGGVADVLRQKRPYAEPDHQGGRQPDKS